MKRIKRHFSLLLFLLMLCSAINGTDSNLLPIDLATTKTVQAASTSSGKTATRFTGWRGKGLRRRYYKNGRILTGFCKIGSDYYFFDSKGRIKTGWQYARNRYRLFHKATGKMVRSRIYHGRRIDKYGAWTPVVVLDPGQMEW